MKKPKVSVIIPAYNRGRMLGRCLGSVLKQKYNNYEVIVVDNNSTDNTRKIIQSFARKNKRIKYLFEKKIGAGAARFSGEMNSKGKIILMTDSDCIVPKNWIEEMIEPIVKGKAIAVQGIKKATARNYWTMHMEQEERRCVSERIKDNKIGLLDTANFAIKKSVLKNAGYTNPESSIVNDLELDARLKIMGYRIFFKKFVVFHHHADSAAGVFRKIFIRGFWNARIRENYRHYKKLFHLQTKINHLNYFASIFFKFLILNPDFRYDFVSGIAWRLGLIWGYMHPKKIKLRAYDF